MEQARECHVRRLLMPTISQGWQAEKDVTLIGTLGRRYLEQKNIEHIGAKGVQESEEDGIDQINLQGREWSCHHCEGGYDKRILPCSPPSWKGQL